MSEKNNLKINPTLAVPLLMLLGALSLWSALEVRSYFSAIPLLLFAGCTILLAIGHYFGELLFQHATHDGYLYTLMGMVAASLLSSSLLLISSEAAHIDNTLDGLSMFRISLVIGAPIGVMIWIAISKSIGIRNIVILKCFLISSAFITATIASQINRMAGELEEATLIVDVIDKEQNTLGPLSYLANREPAQYIFIPYEESVERLAAPREIWSALFKSATIRLSVQPGFFGYKYIARFNDRPLR